MVIVHGDIHGWDLPVQRRPVCFCDPVSDCGHGTIAGHQHLWCRRDVTQSGRNRASGKPLLLKAHTVPLAGPKSGSQVK